MFDCSYLSVCFTYFEPLPNKGQERGKRAKPAISAHSQSQSLNIARAAQRHCQRCPAFRLSNGPRLCLYVLALHSSKAKKKKKKNQPACCGEPHCRIAQGRDGGERRPRTCLYRGDPCVSELHLYQEIYFAHKSAPPSSRSLKESLIFLYHL